VHASHVMAKAETLTQTLPQNSDRRGLNGLFINSGFG
jgi:hypothetical protein